MKRILILYRDYAVSLPWFIDAAKKHKIQIDHAFYSDDLANIDLRQYSAIYARDPFVFSEDITPDLIASIDAFLQRAKRLGVYSIDGMYSFDDLLIEDKWRQYTYLQQFMPHTEKYTGPEQFVVNTHLLKKRISSRCRGLFFSIEDLTIPMDEVIIQKQVTASAEYRVYAVRNTILPLASIKSQRTHSSKSHVKGVIVVPDHIKQFAQELTMEHPFDFVGYDIIESYEGLYLIEANRSCQFNSFNRLSDSNIAEYFLDEIVQYI